MSPKAEDTIKALSFDESNYCGIQKHNERQSESSKPSISFNDSQYCFTQESNSPKDIESQIHEKEVQDLHKDTARPAKKQKNKREDTKSERKNNRPSCFAVLVLSLLVCVPLGGSIYTQRNLSFAYLTNPLILTESIEPVKRVGLFEVFLCAAEQKAISKENQPRIPTLPTSNEPYIFDYVQKESNVQTILDEPITFEFEGAGCTSMKLQAQDTNDLFWMLSRSFSSGAVYMGIISTISLWLSFFFDGAHLLSVGTAFFITYLLQISVFLIYDSKICVRNGCRPDIGTYSCIGTSVLWLLLGLYIIKLSNKKKRRKKYSSKKTKSKNSSETISTVENTCVEFSSISEDVKASKLSEEQPPSSLHNFEDMRGKVKISLSNLEEMHVNSPSHKLQNKINMTQGTLMVI